MSSFIKDIAEIQSAGLPLDASTNLSVIDKHLEDAENHFVKPVLGDAFFQEVKTGLGAAAPLAKWEALLPYLQVPTAFNGYYRFSKIPGGQINHRGYHRDVSEHSTHAPKWEMDQLKETLICQADFGLDALIAFLQENQADYLIWKTSPYYLANTGLIIPTASVFNTFVNISCSGIVFQSLLHYRLYAERALVRLICKPMLDRIKTELQQDGGPGEPVSVLLDYLRPVVAYDTIARGIKKINFVYSGTGIYHHTYSDGTLTKKALSMAECRELAREWEADYITARDEAIAFLAQNIADYPEYATSPCFKEDSSVLATRYDNTIEKKHFGL